MLDKIFRDKYLIDSTACMQAALAEAGIPFIIPVNEKGMPTKPFAKAFESMGEQYNTFIRTQYGW